MSLWIGFLLFLIGCLLALLVHFFPFKSEEETTTRHRDPENRRRKRSDTVYVEGYFLKPVNSYSIEDAEDPCLSTVLEEKLPETPINN